MPAKHSIYFCDGKYVPADKATISVNDLGVVRGFGLFESLRTYGGTPFLLKAHLDRFFQGAKVAGLKPPITRMELTTIVSQLLKKNHFHEALIRIVLTGGIAYGLLPQNRASLIVLVDPFVPFPNRQYQQGIRVMTAPFGRIFPEIKSTVYFSAVAQTVKAARKGFNEAIYVDSKGALLEGTTYNVFAVLRGPRLVTPSQGVLPGITAKLVIALARKIHVPVQFQPISRHQLRCCKELFITSSNRELIPVYKVDQIQIGRGKPGPITQRIHSEYLKRVRFECPDYSGS